MRQQFLLLGLLSVAASMAHAEPDNLISAWRAALQTDAELAAARADLKIVHEEIPQARAQLLPQVNANYSLGRAESDITSQTLLGPNTRTEQYATKSWAVQFRQPLFRARAIATYQQAKQLDSAAQARWQAAESSLGVRFLDVWADRLQQAAQRESAIVDINAAKAFIELSERQLKAGEVSKQELLEARLSLAQGQLALAEADRLERISALNWRMLTGDYPLPPVRLPERAIVELVADAGAELDFGNLIANHPLIKAAESDIAAARLEVNKAKADALPSIDLTAARTFTDSESENVIGSVYNTTRYAVQVSMPLFTSGAIRSGIAEAEARLERAQSQWRMERQRVQRAAESGWLELQASLARWSTASAQRDLALASLRKAELGLSGGISTRADVARAKKELALASKTRSESAADSLRLWARFQEATGSLGESSLQRLAHVTKW